MAKGSQKLSVEVHKFCGASLADGAAFRRVVEILAGRRGQRVAVVSAPAGVTDLLLGLATRATAGETELGPEVEALTARYLEILRAAAGRGHTVTSAEIKASMDELGRMLASLAVLHELTPRTRDFVVSRGERLSARILAATLEAKGIRARYVDATEVIFTDGPYGGASPNLMVTDLRARKVLRPICASGVIPVVPGFIGAAPADDERDVQLGRPLRDGHDVDAGLGQRREDPGGDAGVAGHADADDGDRGDAGARLDAVDLAARDLLAELLGQPVARLARRRLRDGEADRLFGR